MSTPSSTKNANVVRTYKSRHTHSCPPYPIEKCGFSWAIVNLKTIFIFANPALQPGDQVAMDKLIPLSINHADPHYYLPDQAAARPAAAVTASAPTHQIGKKGYTPDTYKSPEEIWAITRSLC